MDFTNNFLSFISTTQLLKSTLRHSWTSDTSRQEITAEHTWHLLLMAMVLAPQLNHKIDLLKVLQMLTIHDLGEAIIGDIPAFADRANKYDKEKTALKKILLPLSPKDATTVLSLWEEYSKKETPEAIFAKTLDVLDVLNQHLIADISTWSEVEFTFNIDRASEKYFRNEPVLLNIYNSLIDQLHKKIKSARKN